MHKPTTTALLLLSLAAAVFAADPPDPKFDRKTYEATRLGNPIVVDGVIDAAEWAAVKTRQLFPQMLFSYKLNPQTVLFVGYSSTRFGSDTLDYGETDRTLFVKVGYAWAM